MLLKGWWADYWGTYWASDYWPSNPTAIAAARFYEICLDVSLVENYGMSISKVEDYNSAVTLSNDLNVNVKSYSS